MSLLISEEVLKSAQLSPEEFKVEVAIMLFQLKRFTLGQASRYLGIAQMDFQSILEDREIPIHYSVRDFQDDMKTIESLNL